MCSLCFSLSFSTASTMTLNPPSFLIDSVLNAAESFMISKIARQDERVISICSTISSQLPVVCVSTSTVPVAWDGLGVKRDDNSGDLSDPLKKGRAPFNHNNFNRTRCHSITKASSLIRIRSHDYYHYLKKVA